MIGINTIDDLTGKFGVNTGDIVMCTYNCTSHDILDIAVGMYNPYEGISKRGLYENTVDLSGNAKQRQDIVKSEYFFWIHSIGHGFGSRKNYYNSEPNVRVAVCDLRDFKLIMKAKDAAQFYCSSIL